MTLPELCIKRPVFTTMLILLPVTLGIFSYMNMGVDLFPNVDLPIVTVTARKLEAYNLSIENVRQALANQNLELPGGRVDQNSRELVLRTMGRVENAAQFADIIVANVAGQPIRIRDVGAVGDSYEEPR